MGPKIRAVPSSSLILTSSDDEITLCDLDGSRWSYQTENAIEDATAFRAADQSVKAAVLIEAADLILLDNSEKNRLVPVVRLALPTLCGESRYRPHWDSRPTRSTAFVFTKIVKVVRWPSKVSHIGVCSATTNTVIFFDIQNIGQPDLLQKEMSNRIFITTFGYKSMEKAAELTQDLLVLDDPPPFIMSIQEVENRRLFNQAIKFLGIKPDVNSHYLFPDQIQFTDEDAIAVRHALQGGMPLRRSVDGGSEEFVNSDDSFKDVDGSIRTASEAGESQQTMADAQATFLFLGFQPAAAFCNVTQTHRWRSANKKTFIFSQPLLSTAFYPNQRIVGYSWHPESSHIIALWDTYGRVSIWDLVNIRLVSFWKASRLAQVGWLANNQQVVERDWTLGDTKYISFSEAVGNHNNYKWKCVLYHASRGIIELFDPEISAVLDQQTVRNMSHESVFLSNSARKMAFWCLI